MKSRRLILLDRLLRGIAAVAVVVILTRLGWMLCAEKFNLVRTTQFIGHSDEAAYVAMGESLAAGQGLNVRYISWFFVPYPPGVIHREDHWPPFMGFVIAPCFIALGKAPWVAKLPAIFFGSIGLPLTTALLAYALSRRGYVAIGAGLLMMAHPVMFTESLKTLSDVAAAMLLAGFCWGLVAAWKRPWMHLTAGFFAACAYYAKGSELILLALYPLLALLIEGPRVLARRWIYLGMFTAVLLMAPYWYSNWKLYANPFHSTQNYVSGYMGLADWETATYAPYWGGRGMPLPQTSDRWTKYSGQFKQHSAKNRLALATYFLSGGYSESFVWDDFGGKGLWVSQWLQGNDPYKPPYATRFSIERRRMDLAEPIKPIRQWHAEPWELAAIGSVGLVALAVTLLPMLIMGRVARWMYRKVARWRKPPDASATAPAATVASSPAKPSTWSSRPLRHFTGAVAALGVVIAVHAGFLVYLWDVQPRFCFIFLPILAALGCTAFSIVVDWPVALAGKLITALWRRIGRGLALLQALGLLRNWHVAVTIALAAWLWLHAPKLKADYLAWQTRTRESDYPYRDQLRYVEVGQWIAGHLPNAVIMTRNPWELLFYCAPTNKAVNYPLVDSESRSLTVIFSIAKYYHVTHIYLDVDRPGLRNYVLRNRPGLRRVPGGPEGLYEIVDYQLLPARDIDALFPPASASAAGATAGTLGASKSNSAMR